MITLRVDYLDELYAIEPLWTRCNQSKVELREMKADDLRNAIQKPLQVHHPQKCFAPELLDRLMQDAGADAALLPLLQVTLAELFNSRRLVLSNYHSLTNAIRQRAEMVYAFRDYDKADSQIKRPTHEQAELMAILLDLINVSVDGADHRDARQRRTRQELEQGAAHRPRLIEELINARLLAAASETRNGADVEVIDIIHESLIDNWNRLRKGIEEQRQQLQRRARFKLWLGEWLRSGRQDGYLLLTDMQLAEAQVLVGRQDIEVRGKEAQEFYQHSRVHRDKIQRRQVRIFRTIAVIMGFLLALAILAAMFSYYLNGQLTKVNNDLQTSLAETKRNFNVAFSRQLAAQSTRELGQNNYELAVLLAIESGRVTDTVESFAAIRDTIANPWHSRVVIYGHTAGVIQAIWNQNESKILTTGYYPDNTARIWDAATGQEVVKLVGHTNSVSGASWSQDERKILTRSDDKTARVWDAITGIELFKLTGHTTNVTQSIWSQDGSKILTSSGYPDNTARIWDATRGIELLKFENVWEVAWNHDESKLLASSYDDTARVWDATTGQELVKLVGHTDWVRKAIWSQDESKILTSGNDDTARIWDASTGQELMKLGGHTASIKQATWNWDESKILTESNYPNNSVRIWDAATGKELINFKGYYNEGVWQATWSQDGNKILAVSPLYPDNAVRIWDATTGQELVTLLGRTGEVKQVIWNQDESKILTLSDFSNNSDKVARIWDATTGQELVTLPGVKQAIWNQDESKILTLSDYAVRIWDTAIGQELVKLEEIKKATWNQDEDRILTIGDYAVDIWDTDTGQELIRLERLEQAGVMMNFSQATWNQDESRILTVDSDTVRIWDATTGQELVKFIGGEQATWNRNGSKILTTNDYPDNTARIWDAATGKELVKLEGHTNTIYGGGAWNLDESKILTYGADGTARIWNATNGQELVKFVGHTAAVVQATWNQDESKLLTYSSYSDDTVRIWDATSGQELIRLAVYAEEIWLAIWSQDGNKILIISCEESDDDTCIRNSVHIWDAATGQELIKFSDSTEGVWQATWNQDESKLLASSYHTARVWDAATGQELIRFVGHTGSVEQATWNRNESKVLTAGADNTSRIWDAASGKELVKLIGHTGAVLQATWSHDESKILTTSADRTARIWYVHMGDLLVAACTWTPRNFTWGEWDVYMEGDYRPTCPTAPIPPDAITAITDKARQQIRANQIVSATQRLDQLNGWLQASGQFNSFGVDVPAFLAEISAMATAEVLPTSTFTFTPTPSATPIPQQPASPLGVQQTSPLPSPTVTLTP